MYAIVVLIFVCNLYLCLNYLSISFIFLWFPDLIIYEQETVQ